MTTYSVPYGKTELTFALPPGMTTVVARSRSLPRVPDVAAAMIEGLRRPVGSPPLQALVRPGGPVVIAVTDVTRACPDHILVPPVLAELEAAGARKEDITILVALGMHRPSTPDEQRAKLGAEICQRYRVVNPDPRDPERLVSLGVSADGLPLVVDRQAAEADLLIATGIVEPHQYAGYSGGAKTVAIGCGGEATIEATHGPRMLEHPRVRLGVVEGNPFHAAVLESGRRAGLGFIVNAVLDDDKHVVAIRAGDREAAYLELVAIARDLYVVPVDGQFDAIVAGVGHPKDANLYQASRAASYLVFGRQPVVREGGVIIIPAPLGEGGGDGAGEQRFIQRMRHAANLEQIIDDAHLHGYKAGEQRAFVLAHVLRHCRVIVVGARQPQVVRDAHMLPVATMAEALAIVGQRQPDARVLILPHALLTLPEVRERQG